MSFRASVLSLLIRNIESFGVRFLMIAQAIPTGMRDEPMMPHFRLIVFAMNVVAVAVVLAFYFGLLH
jgi:hypothetical protein